MNLSTQARLLVSTVRSRLLTALAQTGRFIEWVQQVDQAGISATHKADIGKKLAEAFEVYDAIALLVQPSPFSDGSGLADSETKSLEKVLSEEISATDDLHGLVGDDQYAFVVKTLRDVARFTDSLTAVVEFYRSLTDSAGVEANVSKGPGVLAKDTYFAEDYTGIDYVDNRMSGVLSDISIRVIGSNKQEQIALSDLFAATSAFTRARDETIRLLERLSLAVATPLADSFYLAEAVSLRAGIPFSESGSFSDAGSLLNQGYVSSDVYFASDYLGSAATF